MISLVIKESMSEKEIMDQIVKNIICLFEFF